MVVVERWCGKKEWESEGGGERKKKTDIFGSGGGAGMNG
jgi:hypothetical protein